MLPCASRDAGLEPEVAKRIVMTASRLLGATAAYLILLSFAAGHRKLYWNGCIKSARVICQHFGADDFPFKILFKKCFKIVFFFLWRRDPVLELQFLALLRVVLLCFATQCLQIAL